jgi:FKBP-type peptidyl-prolyl cis-trans isomerase FklB
MMTVGSKWQLFIPADLAYGEQGAGDDIGPNAVLIFDIELIAIK